MQKPLIKRSQFIAVTTSSNTSPIKVNIEADEVYVTQTVSNAPAQIRRQRERDLATFLASNTGITGGNTQTWGNIDPSFGRVPLDVPISLVGNFNNEPHTTATGNLENPERIRNQSVGFKEMIEVRSATEGQVVNIVIETIHYVPADQIGA